jgi:hypothetical protein
VGHPRRDRGPQPHLARLGTYFRTGNAALQARWEDSLRQRARLAEGSAVLLLGKLLAGVRPAQTGARTHLAPKIGHRERRNTKRRPPDTA